MLDYNYSQAGDSQFWTEILKHKDHFFSLCRFHVGNGRNVRFWKDWWIGSKALKHSFPRLYNLCFDRNKYVEEILEKEIDNVRFRRTLLGDSLDLWTHVKEACTSIVLYDRKDEVRWTLTKKWFIFS